MKYSSKRHYSSIIGATNQRFCRQRFSRSSELKIGTENFRADQIHSIKLKKEQLAPKWPCLPYITINKKRTLRMIVATHIVATDDSFNIKNRIYILLQAHFAGRNEILKAFHRKAGTHSKTTERYTPLASQLLRRRCILFQLAMSSSYSNLSRHHREKLRVLSFPQKLHMLLRDVETGNLQHVASWNAEGTGFVIHNKYFFEAHILPQYFNSTQYRAFQRSLNVWGFSVVSKGKQRGTCWHPYFRRDREDLCEYIERVPIKSSSQKCSSDKISFEEIHLLELPPMKPSSATLEGKGGSSQSHIAPTEEPRDQARESSESAATTNVAARASTLTLPPAVAQASNSTIPDSTIPDNLRLIQRLLAQQPLAGQAIGSAGPLIINHTPILGNRHHRAQEQSQPGLRASVPLLHQSYRGVDVPTPTLQPFYLQQQDPSE